MNILTTNEVIERLRPADPHVGVVVEIGDEKIEGDVVGVTIKDGGAVLEIVW